MPSQPIGYIEPDEGERIALGLAMPHQPEPPPRSLSAAVVGGAQLSPQPFTGPGAGTIANGFGQAPNARSSAPILGLNST